MRSTVKRFVLFLYAWRLIPLRTAQRAINAFGVNDA